MDHTDLQILRLLQTQGRISNQDLAQNVGISTAACWRRTRAMEEQGIIEGYAAIVSRNAVALNLCAFVHVSLRRHHKQESRGFEQAISQIPEVMECFATTGDADFILRVVTSSIESFDRFLEDVLFAEPSVAQVRSNIALREVKFDVTLPI